MSDDVEDRAGDDAPADGEALAALRAAYRQRLGARMAEIATLWRSTQAAGPGSTPAAELTTQVHRLAGSAALYGYAAAGTAAAALEAGLEAWANDGTAAAEVERLVQDLERAAALD